MNEYVHIVRRHGKTAKGADGKKLDDITDEAAVQLRSQGERLKEEYPEYEFYGYSAPNGRTKRSRDCLIEGAGYDAGSRSETLDCLAFNIPRQAQDKIRNTPGLADQYNVLCNQFGREMYDAGSKAAEYLLDRIKDAEGKGDEYRRLDMTVINGPTEEALYCLLVGELPTYDNVRDLSGMFKEATGFKIERKGNTVRITSDRRTVEMTIDEFAENIEKARQKAEGQPDKPEMSSADVQYAAGREYAADDTSAKSQAD